MSLFDKLKDTKLKSLKFGDKGTVGDSTKPYIVTDINTADTFINKFRLTRFDDGLIRGGAVGAANAGLVDTIRIGKFLTDFPKGPLFIAKQVGLQLSNPPLETKQLPTNRIGTGTFGEIVAGISNITNKINNLVGGPTRIYNLGLNTLAQVPVNAIGGHVARHGFLPILDASQKYESVVTENNKNGNNRLEGLYNVFFKLGPHDGSLQQSNIYKTVISDNFGGAKSLYGIGRTTTHRTVFTGRETDIVKAKERSEIKSRDTKITEYGYFNMYEKYRKKYDSKANFEDFKQSKIPYTIASSFVSSALKTNHGLISVTTEPTSSFRFRTRMYDDKFEPLDTKFNKSGSIKQPPSSKEHIDRISSVDIKYKPTKSGISNRLKDNSNTYSGAFEGVDDLISTSVILPTTSNKKYNQLISNTITKNAITVPITLNTPENGVSKKKFQNIDSMIRRNSKYSTDSSDYDYGVSGIDDIYKRDDEEILKIVFTQIDPFTAGDLGKPIPFSAYLSGYSETYDSSWDSIKYNGRSDFLYTFNSYKKTASFKLQIPIFDKEQLRSKHELLKTLQTGLAGKYLNNRLGGVLTKINLGYYLRGAFCIINSLNIIIPAEATWDWGVKEGNEVLAYAMLLEANFQITIIDDKVPGFHQIIVTPPESKITEPKPQTPTPPILKSTLTGGLPGISKIKKSGLFNFFKYGPNEGFSFGGGGFGGGGAGGEYQIIKYL
jgi:hypothetical protein